jgi:hypothetical protein
MNEKPSEAVTLRLVRGDGTPVGTVTYPAGYFDQPPVCSNLMAARYMRATRRRRIRSSRRAGR